MDGSGWTHNDALSHVRRRRIERPEPVLSEVVSGKGNIVKLRNEVRGEGLECVSIFSIGRKAKASMAKTYIYTTDAERVGE